MTVRRLLLAVLLNAAALLGVLVLAPAVASAAVPLASPRPVVVEVQVIPALPGVLVRIDGASARTDRNGRVRLPVAHPAGLSSRVQVGSAVRDGERIELGRVMVLRPPAPGVRRLDIGLQLRRQVRLEYENRQHQAVDPRTLSSVELHNSIGERIVLREAQLRHPLWVATNRIAATPSGLFSKDLEYRVIGVVAHGGQVVYEGQQGFRPARADVWRLNLLFYAVRLTAQDAFFGTPLGSSVQVTRPDGVTTSVAFGPGHVAVLPALARGSYTFRVNAAGLSFLHPVVVSRDQTIALPVISVADLVLLGGVFAGVALALFAIGHPRWRAAVRRLPARIARRRRSLGTAPEAAKGSTALLLLIGLCVAGTTLGARPAPAAAAPPAASSTTTAQPYPVFAYYYIWYNASSWNRAKSDYPAIGRYSSDDATVMRQQVGAAKAAGIGGFLVSWKQSRTLDRRLAKLVDVARAEQFNLGVVYQGLDFSRRPLPVSRVLHDLLALRDSYARDPVFAAFGKPVVIWTGTEQYTTEQIRYVTSRLHPSMLVLASAKSVKDYERVAAVVDGDAYYWSSVDPTNPRYPEKLAQLSSAVHARHGLWIAPAAPGFDARLVGGRSVVDRRGGQTLRDEVNVARSSGPDAIGIISWNEYSENSEVEPSRRYGDEALRTLRTALGANITVLDSPDSSTSDGSFWSVGRVAGTAGGGGLLLALLLAAGYRARSVARRPPLRVAQQPDHRTGQHSGRPGGLGGRR